MHRLLVTLICLALLAACTAATPTPAPTKPPAPTATPVPAQPAATQPTAAAPAVLKLEGPGGTKTLSLDAIKALPVAEGWAGIKSSTGRISVPEVYKGVALNDLCKLVGGLTPETGVNLAAKDGYAMTISFDQITKGDFITYDPGTGDEIKIKDPLTVIIAYERSGKPMPADGEGPLKLVVVSAKNNQVVDGHWAVKWVNQITIKSLALDWKLPLAGAIKEDMDRGTFQSCSSPSCHGAEWTDDKAQKWGGTPLWLLAGRIDDDIKHGDGSFNDKAADQGYVIEVVAADGFKVTFDSARLKRNRNIIVAYQVNNNPLDDKYFPLRLVGSDLKGNEMVGQIAKINLRLAIQAAQATATAKPTEAPKPAATQAPVATGNAALSVTGAVEKELALTLDAFKGLGLVKIKAEHPKQGMQEYEGVRLSVLLDQAKLKTGAAKLLFISRDGYTVEAALTDVRACADCLLALSDGKFGAAMPGMQSNFWAKDVVKIEIK